MEKELVACVPNFSEGRNPDSIASIKRAIESVSGVKILHTDIGFSVNRTVITFVGPPQQIVEAAFLGAPTCRSAELSIAFRLSFLESKVVDVPPEAAAM
jgi:glutamate formiminotransferase/formiminotetrahydrofolate cyclodeaminase